MAARGRRACGSTPTSPGLELRAPPGSPLGRVRVRASQPASQPARRARARAGASPGFGRSGYRYRRGPGPSRRSSWGSGVARDWDYGEGNGLEEQVGNKLGRSGDGWEASCVRKQNGRGPERAGGVGVGGARWERSPSWKCRKEPKLARRRPKAGASRGTARGFSSLGPGPHLISQAALPFASHVSAPRISTTFPFASFQTQIFTTKGHLRATSGGKPGGPDLVAARPPGRPVGVGRGGDAPAEREALCPGHMPSTRRPGHCPVGFPTSAVHPSRRLRSVSPSVQSFC